MKASRNSQRYEGGKWKPLEIRVIGEAPVALTVNSQVWLTLMCTPQDLEALVLGFLFNEGVIQGMQDVADIRPCEHGDNVDIWLTNAAEQPRHWKRTSGCTGGMSAVELTLENAAADRLTPDGWQVSPQQILRLVAGMLEMQEQHRRTGGVHAAALSDGERILVTAEDVGRHNTIDKVAGKCLQENIWPEHRIILTTGRISSEMLQKSAHLGAGIVISITAPTSLAVELAEALGITLICYARGEHFTVYAHPERIEAFQ